jgi:D-Tyr-tRNAtyr deacylase
MDALAEFKRTLTPNGQRLECKLQENEGVFRSISQITLEANQSRGRKNGGETRNEWYPAWPDCKTSGLVIS